MSDSESVPAHDQTLTHHYVVHYPPHPARKSDPHYVDFNHYHQQTRPTARCYIGQRVGYGDCADEHGQPCPPPAEGEQPGLELHHAHVEFSLQNGISLTALEVDYPGISDPTTLGAWVESAANFRWLCVAPDVPVLMADGTERPIQSVQAGDRVIGHDGRPHAVTAAGSRFYWGRMHRWGECAVTASHALLTRNGWLPASEIRDEVRVMTAKVFALGFDQFEVLGSVVGPVAVPMMNTLAAQQRPTQNSLHDKPMLHDQPFAVPHAHVTLDRGLRRSAADVPSGQAAQSFEPALVGAVPPRSGASEGNELRSAGLAHHLGRSPLEAGARLAARRVGIGREWRPAVDARSGGSHSATSYRGRVYDITVEGSHSFFAGGVAVHNCVYHHRGPGGAHTAAHADWEASQYVYGLIGKAP